MDAMEEKRSAWQLMERFQGDKVILMITVLLMLTSVVSIFSSSSLLAVQQNTDRFSIVKDQLIVMALGLAVVALCYFVIRNVKVYKFFSQFGFAFSLILLLILVSGANLGFISARTVNGAQRVLLVAGKQIHVYEVVKVCMVMYLAWAITAYKDDEFWFANWFGGKNESFSWLLKPFWKKFLYIYVPVLSVMGLVFLGSFSSAMFIGLILIVTILVGGVGLKEVGLLAVVMGLLLGGIFFAYGKGWIGETGRMATAISRLTNNDEKTMEQMLAAKPYSAEFNSARDKLKQPVSAQLAIKEGGFFGKGIGNSTQKYVVPVFYGDYIYSFLIEETGFLGGVLILLLYLSLFARGAIIAKDCGDNYFAKTAVAGLIILISGQAFMHMAVNVHLAPQTGQTLPLISHGDSSFLVFSLAFGILLSFSRSVRVKMLRREAEADASPLIEHHDEVRSALEDLDQLDNLESEEL
ncbi:MAG: FtsW/RodA/SpoVE family cell cycle protein [Bacteroidales bacterium]|nr:FtsW/RodA/SpoVE family cell cycle protein [Bacteroidales bacterium]